MDPDTINCVILQIHVEKKYRNSQPHHLTSNQSKSEVWEQKKSSKDRHKLILDQLRYEDYDQDKLFDMVNLARTWEQTSAKEITKKFYSQGCYGAEVKHSL